MIKKEIAFPSVCKFSIHSHFQCTRSINSSFYSGSKLRWKYAIYRMYSAPHHQIYLSFCVGMISKTITFAYRQTYIMCINTCTHTRSIYNTQHIAYTCTRVPEIYDSINNFVLPITVICTLYSLMKAIYLSLPFAGYEKKLSPCFPVFTFPPIADALPKYVLNNKRLILSLILFSN